MAAVGGRMTIILLLFFIAFGALAARLVVLQVVERDTYAAAAARQHRAVKEFIPERGTLWATDKDGTPAPLAFSRTYKTLIASPRIVEDAGATADAIAEHFGISRDAVFEQVSRKDDPYEIVAKKITPEDAAKFAARRIAGLSFEDDVRRVYPQGNSAAHLVGFAAKEAEREMGKYGLERQYDKLLAGTAGAFEGVRGASGFLSALAGRIANPDAGGRDLFLTVDYNIQAKAETVVTRAAERWSARSAIVIVLEPKTGRILALAGIPAFDPNAYSKEKDYSVFLNPAVEFVYEAGSALKPITMAAAIEEGVVTPQTTYEDTGRVVIGGYTIRNFDGKAYGVQTMAEVLEKSLNTGMVWVAKLLGKEKQRAYLKLFGFGEKTGVDLPGEVAGDISNLDEGRDIEYMTASFGQGIAVTPLQLAAATAAIANGGLLMRPYVVEKIRDAAGNITEVRPEERRRVISPLAAETLTKMLVSVVRNGAGVHNAGVAGYFVAGKTGTAQIPRRDGRGYSDEFMHTFVGFAPAFDPRFLVLLRLEAPRGNLFAANTLSGPFHDIAEYILNYYEIPPDEQ